MAEMGTENTEIVEQTPEQIAATEAAAAEAAKAAESTEETEEQKAEREAAEAAAVTQKEKKFTDEDMKRTRQSLQHETRKERDARIAAETEARVLRELLGKGVVAPNTETGVQASTDTPASRPVRPLEGDFETREEYAKALDKYEDDAYMYRKSLEQKQDAERQAREKQKTAQLTMKQSVEKAVNEGRSKYVDYDEVVLENPSMVSTPMTVAAIVKMTNAADVAYHLGKNPAEGRRLAEIDDPIDLAIAVREISDKLKAVKSPTPAAPQKTKAPAPASTVAAKSKGTPADTSLEGKSQEERLRLLEEASLARRKSGAWKRA